MTRRRVRETPPYELLDKWKRDIRFIGEFNNYVAIHRIRVQQVEGWLGFARESITPSLFNRNLQAWGWIRSLWVPVGLMHVRRELDGQHGTVCMMRLLREIEARPGVLKTPTVEVVADRRDLERECKGSLEYAHRQLAHRTEMDEPDMADLNSALDAVFACVEKYHLLITGRRLEPEELALDPQWVEAFKYVWYRPLGREAPCPMGER